MSRPDMNDEELLASWELVTRAVAGTQTRVFEGIERSGLPAQWFGVLHLLLRSYGHRLPMSRLARELSITTGGFTKLADRMGQEGLINRRNSSGDRRVVYAALTEVGLRLARRTQRQYLAALREHVLTPLSADRLVALAEISRVLAEVHAAPPEELAEPDARPERGAALPDRRRRPTGQPATDSR